MKKTVDTELLRRAGANCSEETLKHFLYLNGLQTPEKPAYEWFDEAQGKVVGVSYLELMSDIAAMGTAFHARGWRGRTLGLIGATSYSWVLAFVTCICSSMTVLPLDPSLSPEELAGRLRHCRSALVLADPKKAEQLGAAVNDGEMELYSLSETDALLEEGRRLLEAGDHAWIDNFVSDKQIALMIFTSGTGGKNKAAMIRQENLMAERYVWIGIQANQSKGLLTLPLFHIAGIKDLYGALLTGATLYLCGGLRHLLRDYAYVQPVTTFMVPAQAELVCQMLQGRSAEEARNLLGGHLVALRTSGAPMPERMRALFTAWNIDITSDYGMTETGGPVSVSVMKNGRLFSKPGSVGRILDCLDVRIDHPDENGCGEVIISGISIFDGYFEDPEETEKILRDGWLHTGDIGRIDEDRYLYIVGRSKNILILSNGENIIPEELEKAVSAIPEVKECLVFKKDEKLAVRIYAGTPEPELENHLKDEVRKLNGTMPAYKQIRIVELAAEPLPKTATGKLKRENFHA